MTDEELKTEFKKLHAGQLRIVLMLLLLLLAVGILTIVAQRQTARLVCSADNPPKACRE